MSTLKADTIVASDGSSPVTLTKQSAAKAWVNFNGTGTIATRDSLNVASLTDQGTGDYTINFSNAMSNTSYSVNINGSGSSFSYPRLTACGTSGDTGFATTSHGMISLIPSSFAADDIEFVVTSLHGDLA